MLKNFRGAPKLWYVRIPNYAENDYRLNSCYKKEGASIITHEEKKITVRPKYRTGSVLSYYIHARTW
jgi:hypothetical protein